MFEKKLLVWPYKEWQHLLRKQISLAGELDACKPMSCCSMLEADKTQDDEQPSR
jgi:hypothetical protein